MKKEYFFEALFVAVLFGICLAGAILLPMDMCPDESGRLRLTKWIVETGTLPIGHEKETLLGGWGFSYALRPYLSSMIGAVFVKLLAPFTVSAKYLLAAARMGSVLSVTVCGAYCLKIGKLCFQKTSAAFCMATMVCFIPQVLFLGMYCNNDSLSLCAVSMVVYYLAEGQKNRWSIKSCIGLGISFSIGLLAYYSVYGWFLLGGILFLISMLINKDIKDKKSFVMKRLVIVGGICLLLAGWFFVRNGIYHNGDFLGMTSEKTMRAEYAAKGMELIPYRSLKGQGYSMKFWDSSYEPWRRTTAQSFVGVFGYMTILLPDWMYTAYAYIYGLGVVGFFLALLRGKVKKENLALTLIMFLSSLINIGLCFWQSYFRDNQPQGRYIIATAVFLAFMMTCGMSQFDVATGQGKKKGLKKVVTVLQPAYIISIVWILLFVFSLETMKKMLV